MKKRCGFYCLISNIIIICTLWIFPGWVYGSELPLWEAGLGIAFLELPDYRGSDEVRPYLLPVPYLIYRGEILRVDRERVRGLLFHSDAVQLDISLNASVPVNSVKNKARQGMPDLDPTVEIGPSLDIILAENKPDGYKLTLNLPGRVVIATDLSHFQRAGWVFSPRINMDKSDFWGRRGWNLGLALGPLFADKRYHNFYYAVDPSFATPQRPEFATGGGYSGTQITLSLSKHFSRLWFGSFVRLDLLNGAIFENSPLLKTKQSFMGGFAFAWIFAKSKRLVSPAK